MAKLKPNNVKFSRSVGTTHVVPDPPPVYTNMTQTQTIGSGGDIMKYNDTKLAVTNTSKKSIHVFDKVTGSGSPIAYLNLNGTVISTSSFDISDTKIAVGENWNNEGRVLIYNFNPNGGSLLHTINNPSPSAGDKFGVRLAMSNQYICATSDKYDAVNGQIYVYDHDTYALLYTITNPNVWSSEVNFGDEFGEQNMNIFDNKLYVGVREDIDGIAESGVLYIFDLENNGALITTITEPTPSNKANFAAGYTRVDSDGTHIVVGSNTSSSSSSNRGELHVFNTDGTYVGLIENPYNPGTLSAYQFGSICSVDNGNIVIGMTGSISTTAEKGIVYVYNVSDLSTPKITFNNPSPSTNDYFGQAVHIDGNKLYVTSRQTNISSYEDIWVYTLT